MKYDKLVRDRIPEMIEQSGKKAVIRILDDKEFKVYLEKKLDEEVAEFHESKDVEELADILQVIIALCNVRGMDFYDLVRIANMKIVARGGFKDKILLLEVSEDEQRETER